MTLGQLIRLSRPPTLAATLAPVLTGGALASGSAFSLGLWLLVALVALLLQVGANVINEYADFAGGVDVPSSTGIAGVLVRGELTPGRVGEAAAAVFFLALAGGVVLVLARGWVLLALGLFAAAGNLLYSLGPRPLSATPVGEAWVFLLMGPVEVVAVQMAASGHITGQAVWVGVAVGLLTAAILVANHLRDRSQDLASGRRTLVGVLGEETGRRLLILLAVGGVVLAPFLALLGALPLWCLITLCALPVTLRLWREENLPRLLPLAAQNDLLAGALLALALLIGR